MELDGRDDRKTSFRNGAYDQPAFERISSQEIRISGIDLARQILRGNGLRQAGFMAELANRFTRSSRAPVLFQEGEAHRKQRSATARFFAPRVVAMRYRQLMAEQSARIMRDFRATGRADLDSMGMELSVAVTAEIVGLNDSSLPGLASRLSSFLADQQQQRVGKLAASLRMVVALGRILRFFFCDVMPAVRSHRIQRREDIISLLIEQGYSTREILTECITYGVAGVATTRELIVLAAWHLFDRPELRKRFLDSDEAGRIVVLEEVLRLEPVVGTLYRRAERDIILNDNGRPEDVSAGTLLAIDIRAVNADPAAGVCPHRLDPDRQIQDHRLPGSLMSFGDGAHRCPGAAIALQESAIFLDQLFRVPGIRLARAPTVSSNSVAESYELRGAVVTCATGGAVAVRQEPANPA